MSGAVKVQSQYDTAFKAIVSLESSSLGHESRRRLTTLKCKLKTPISTKIGLQRLTSMIALFGAEYPCFRDHTLAPQPHRPHILAGLISLTANWPTRGKLTQGNPASKLSLYHTPMYRFKRGHHYDGKR